MRVAVIIFGQPRFFDITASLIKQEFEFDGVDVDYYIHFWDSIGYTPLGDEVKINDHIYNVLDKEFSSANVQITNYDKLDEIGHKIHSYYYDVVSRDTPIENGLTDLRYTFGQHVSVQTAYEAVKYHEIKKNFQYDLIIKTRSDIIYKIPECYTTEKQYIAAKKEYYFNNSNLYKSFMKCTALRFLNLTKKVHDPNGEAMNKIIYSFFDNKYQESKEREWWEQYNEEYYIRLCHNDWTLVASRLAADIYFSRWFENFHYCLTKDLLTNKNNMKKCIMNSQHSMQGQFLLNNKIQAVNAGVDKSRRDVRLLNKHEIKDDVMPNNKILVRPGQSNTDFLRYALIKRWSDNVSVGRERAIRFEQEYGFVK